MILKWIADILGWAGAVCLLMAYALLSTDKLKGDAVCYQTLNLLGAGFLMVNSMYYGAYPSVTVNGIWMGIGMFSLIWRRKAE